MMSTSIKEKEAYSNAVIQDILNEIERLKLSHIEQSNRLQLLEGRNNELQAKIASIEEPRSQTALTIKPSLKSKKEQSVTDAVCLRFIEENYIKTGLREDRIDSSTVWAKYSSMLKWTRYLVVERLTSMWA